MVHSHKLLQNMPDTHNEVFADGLQTDNGVTATVHVDPTATLKFHKTRPLPYTLGEG